ncbi:MAG: hypothetical protein C4583_15195 [Anaerolineaceae bacterium]|nr:MAG: hypothetical protein C4583_15195 [Anaerolineaceae bacterium]
MEIRSDFASAKVYLERLIIFGNVFHENNIKHWPYLKNNEDFKLVNNLNDEAHHKFYVIYSTGRDLAVYMSFHLEAFNYPADYPTLTSYINSFDDGWLDEIEQLKETSTQAKEERDKLKHNCPLAVKEMIILFDKQIELLQHIIDTLKIIRTTDIYKVESEGKVMEKPTITVQGDYLSFQNVSTEGHGQVFIGKFNKAVATLNNAGQTELATALQKLQEAILASDYLSDDKKKEHIEVLNQVGEEVAKEKPNGTLIKVMSDGLLSILKSIPDIAKAVSAVIPLLPR